MPKYILAPVKRVPLNISELLIDPLALAIWYLDDGTRRDDTASCRIATQSFSEEENILLKDSLWNTFSLPANVEKTGRKENGDTAYGLAILSKTGGYKRLQHLISDIVRAEIPSMLYKLR